MLKKDKKMSGSVILHLMKPAMCLQLLDRLHRACSANEMKNKKTDNCGIPRTENNTLLCFSAL